MADEAKYEIRFLGMFPHVPELTLECVGLQKGDRLVVLKMVGDTEAVVMVERDEKAKETGE